MLGLKANKVLSNENAETLNDTALIQNFAQNPTQLILLDELDSVIENVALELSHVSTSKKRQLALLNRLDMMLQTIEKYQDEVPILSSTRSTIVLVKLTYLERKSDFFNSDEILDAVEKHKSSIQFGNYQKQVQRIRKKALSKKLNSVCQDEGLLWFQQRVDIENMNLAEVNVFFNWYNDKNIPQALEIVRLGKQQILEQIRKDITKEANALVRTYPWLEKLLHKKEAILGKGKSGIVLESAKSNTVIKIYHSGDIPSLISEFNTHADFRDAIRYGKLARTAYGNPFVPDWVQIPDIYQIPNPAATKVWERTYLMDRVKGVTLKRWVYLKLNEYQSKLKPFTTSEIQSLSEIEFEELLEKRNLLHYFVYRTLPLKAKNELLPEVFFKAFENDPIRTKGLQQALEYLRDEHQLVHKDLHWKNILIGDKGKVYLIDFAP